MSAFVISGLGTAVRGIESPAALLGTAGQESTGPDPVSRLTGRGLRYKDRATKLAMVAGRDALRDAGLLDANGELTVPSATTGVVVSTNFGNADTVCETVRTIADETYLGTSPMMLPATSSNVVASWLAITHGLRGANLTLCNGPTSGLDAVHWARLLIESGRLDRALVVGVEPDNPAVRHLTGRGATDLAEAAAEAAADAAGDGGAPGASGPFDGAVALVVESAASAQARGARLLARLGPYARRASHAAAVGTVCSAAPGPVGMWCVPEHPDGVAAPAPTLGVALGDARLHDLSALLGPASGALGVLQAAAATVWLAGGGSTALASAGTGDAGDDDASAALILATAGSAP